MITSRIKIEDGEIYDFENKYGFVYVSSDNIFAAPLKPFESTSYPEEVGVHILPKTVDDTFEYKCIFFIKVNGVLENANRKIYEFNKAICQEVNGVKTFKRITFYNDYKKIKIVGYPYPIQNATEFWRDSKGQNHDIVCVELTIKVTNPSLCDFDTSRVEFEKFMVINDDGEFEEFMIPYLSLNFEDYTFQMGAGALVSYQERGSFVVHENCITATSQTTAFVFEITDQNTLLLVDNGDNEYFKMPINSEYVFRND